MKTTILAITILTGLGATAQDYESIKNTVALTQYQQAKTALDQSMANAKFTSKPDAYILKATVYSSLAMDNKYKSTAEGDRLTNDGDAAFMKYKQMDPGMALLKDPIYQNGAVNLYSSYYTSGYADYTAKKWDAAYSKLKKAVEYSDLLIKNKLMTVAVDTNVLILAGITAENSTFKNEAVLYYGRLADMKIMGDGFESVYRYLVDYYFQKKDWVAFEKYKSIGKALYPTSEYFGFDKVDFSVGLAADLDSKLKALDQLLLTDPNGFKVNQVIGEIIYDALNPQEATTPLPANAVELEKKMIAAFKKAAAAKPGYENSFVYVGDHFINKAVLIDQVRQVFSNAIATRKQSGEVIPKEDIAKVDELDKKYRDVLVLAREPYEKAAKLYGARTDLTLADKKQYKKAANYLADIASFEKIWNKNKGKVADAAKYEAEEKKWVEVAESIKWF